jgi:hypothetical protein
MVISFGAASGCLKLNLSNQADDKKVEVGKIIALGRSGDAITGKERAIRSPLYYVIIP